MRLGNHLLLALLFCMLASPLYADDYAVYARGTDTWDEHVNLDHGWYNGLIGKIQFTRGNNLRCTFTTWGDPSNPGWPIGPNGPIRWPRNSGVFAPFHMVDGNTYWGPMYGTLEAGVATAPPFAPDNTYTFGQHGTWNGGTPSSTAFWDYYSTSTSKANSVRIRVWLGDTNGAKWEWSTNGGQTWTTELDNREAYGDGTQAEVWLGFSTYIGAVFVDDFVVEDDTGVLFTEDFNTGVIDTSRWTAIKGKGGPPPPETSTNKVEIVNLGGGEEPPSHARQWELY